MKNNQIFTLVSDATIEKYMPFKKLNIVERYKKVKEKRPIYNGMQLIAYMEENDISLEQLLIAINSNVLTKDVILSKINGDKDD